LRASKAVFILSLSALVCVTDHTSAQQVPAPTPGVIRINVNLVQVDAVVVDARGKPVRNLKKDDFELFQDGKKQQIRNFEFVRVKDTLASLIVNSNTVPSRGGPAVPPPPPAAPRPDQVRRTIALVVDDIALSFDSTIQVRDSLKKWVNTEMQPGDLVSIVRTNAVMGSLQQFTNDKRMLFAMIDRLKFQPGRVGVSSFASFEPAPPDGATPPADVGFSAELANAYITGSLNAIKYVMQGLRDLPGRKSLIFFSEDLSLTSLDNQRQAIEERLRRLADQANRSSVVFYAIDPRGTIYTGPTASDNLSGRTGAEIANMIGNRSQQLITSQDGMVLLAQRTGGLFFSGSNDLMGPLSKAVDDGDGYYLMGYQPDQATFETKMDTPKYHSITLRVKRPGLKVRSRTGFYGLADSSPVSPAPQTPQSQLARALVSPFTAADLRVRLTTMFENSQKNEPYLQVLLHFDAHDLTFREEANGSRSATIDIAIVLFDENGDPIPSFNNSWTLRVRKEGYDKALNEGFLYTASVPVKKAGPYQMRIALRDATSQKLGSAMQFVEVPDVKAGRLALSGIVLTATTRSEDDPGGSLAVRIFKPASSVDYAFEVFNPNNDSSDKSALRMQTRIYRDGETVYEGTPSPLSPANATDPMRLAAGGRLQLNKLPAGDYVLQVAVFDGSRKDKARVATQAIDFEIRP